MTKGRMKYVPPKMLQELDNVKSTFNIQKDSEAFDKIAEFAPMGVEIEKMRERFFLVDILKKKKR